MPINPDAVGALGDPLERSWTADDCLLYALAVGAGSIDPIGFELEFTTDNTRGVPQKVLPTFGILMSGSSALDKIGDFNRARMVAGEQWIELHRPIPVSGTVISVGRIAAIYDKGSGAVVTTETTSKAPDGTPMWTTRTSVFIRGEGGWGGDRGPSDRFDPPERDPDHVVTYATRPDQALLYRLTGIHNPLHSDPGFARELGFEKPILHGLCTFGFTGRALLHTLCGSDPERFVSMGGRFSKPVYPGEDLTISMWETGPGEAVFRTTTTQGVVLDGGSCTFRP